MPPHPVSEDDVIVVLVAVAIIIFIAGVGFLFFTIGYILGWFHRKYRND